MVRLNGAIVGQHPAERPKRSLVTQSVNAFDAVA